MGSDEVVVSEIVLPYANAVAMGPLGGLHQSQLFAPWLATLREALTASSPYWRLLYAWRVYDGIPYLRGRIKKQSDLLGVTAQSRIFQARSPFLQGAFPPHADRGDVRLGELPVLDGDELREDADGDLLR